MHSGFIKVYRALKKSSFYLDSEYVHLWVHLLMSVNHAEKRLKVEGANQFITLTPGQVLTSRNALSKQTGISESKVQRVLKAFESEQQIEQQTFSKYRVISILNWSKYQEAEQQNEQQVNSNRTASEQQVNTNKNEKNEKNEKNVEEDQGDKSPPPSKLFNLWNEKVKEPRATVMNKTRDAKCRLRLKERSLEEWSTVFDVLVKTPFLRGQNDRGWRADFDWIIANDTNSVKILEGKYSSKIKVGGLSSDFEKTFLGAD